MGKFIYLRGIFLHLSIIGNSNPLSISPVYKISLKFNNSILGEDIELSTHSSYKYLIAISIDLLGKRAP